MIMMSALQDDADDDVAEDADAARRHELRRKRGHKPSSKGNGANKSLRIIKIIYNQRNLATSKEKKNCHLTVNG